jgi:L-ascorbate metabolism protein UlaG (beta-lactamase superfamily)
MRLTWYGHSCFLLETGSHRILFDPWLNENPASPIRAAEARCDFIFCSHAHDDHMADALEIARENRATIVAPYELAEYFSEQGATVLDPMPGGTLTLPFGKVKVTPAVHSSTLETGPNRNRAMGCPVGYVVFCAEKVLYHAGDTALFSDMRLIGRHALDVALLPIGDWYTMGIEDAVEALDLLMPKLAIPMHYNTHAKIAVDPQAFAAAAAIRGHKTVILKPGEALEF